MTTEKRNQAILELARERFRLVTMVDIVNVPEYVEAWRELERKYLAADCPANAAICKSNAERYETYPRR